MKDANVAFKSKNGGADTDYWHETLAGIADAVDGALSEHGLAYSWEPKQLEGGRIEVTCILSHVGGHSRRATLAGSPDASGNKNNLYVFNNNMASCTFIGTYTVAVADDGPVTLDFMDAKTSINSGELGFDTSDFRAEISLIKPYEDLEITSFFISSLIPSC